METCSIWLHPEPALDKIVVSDIGEQLSPNTLPASVADKVTVSSCGAIAYAAGAMIGIRIPKVPQAVPVEKLKKAAIIKISAGSRKAGMLLRAS